MRAGDVVAVRGWYVKVTAMAGAVSSADALRYWQRRGGCPPAERAASTTEAEVRQRFLNEHSRSGTAPMPASYPGTIVPIPPRRLP